MGGSREEGRLPRQDQTAEGGEGQGGQPRQDPGWGGCGESGGEEMKRMPSASDPWIDLLCGIQWITWGNFVTVSRLSTCRNCFTLLWIGCASVVRLTAYWTIYCV